MDRILNALERRSEISAWRIVHKKTTKYQLYVIGNLLDNIRKVVTNKYHVTVYCDHDKFRGDTTITLFENDLDRIEDRLLQAIFIASRINNPGYELPGPADYPFVECFDPTLLGDVEEILFMKLADRLIEAVEQEKDVRLSSSEYFLDLNQFRLRNSKGIDLEFNQTEIFFDGVLLSGRGEREVEIHFEPRARRLQDLPIESIIRTHAQFARDSVHAELPASGQYPVALSGEALSNIFWALIHHTSAAAQYRRTSSFELNDSVYSTGKPKGEPITLISNGYFPFGLQTTPADPDGVPAGRHELIREGCFKKAWSPKQYADYLDIEATGHLANLEIPIGPTSRNDLLTQNGPVLQIVLFSGLLPDPVSGGFAGEIKLGYEYNKGKITPVKGGSVSGNFISGFENAYFSTESRSGYYAQSMDRFGTYHGPDAIRFETFQVSGK